jgi:CRP-like cAMP-binding protein
MSVIEPASPGSLAPATSQDPLSARDTARQITIEVRRRTDSGNGLLDRLARFLPELLRARRRLHIPSRTVLYRPGDPMPFVYFPAGGVISTVLRDDEGETSQVSAVGAEGVAPVFALLGRRKSPLMLVQQVSGDVIRLPADSVARAMRDREPLQSLMLGYISYSLRAAHQAAACNALHGALSRTARALLTTADRAASEHFHMTQDVLAEMLGTPRQTVNVAIRELTRRQLIRVRRGHVQLLDRVALQSASCPCYPVLSGRNWEQAI